MFKTTTAILAAAGALIATGASAQEAGRWDGIYIGAHGAWADGQVRDKSNPLVADQNTDGWLGGAQIGFNSQNGNFLFGVEGDVTFGKNNNEWSDRNSYYGNETIRTSGTVRARAGIASDNALLYVTGGLAIADTKYGLGCQVGLNSAAVGRCSGDNTRNFYAEETKTRFGYVVGGGVELAVNDRISIKGEYNYIDYGTTNIGLVDPISGPNALVPTAPYTPITGGRDFSVSTHLAKVGVNFRF